MARRNLESQFTFCASVLGPGSFLNVSGLSGEEPTSPNPGGQVIRVDFLTDRSEVELFHDDDGGAVIVRREYPMFGRRGRDEATVVNYLSPVPRKFQGEPNQAFVLGKDAKTPDTEPRMRRQSPAPPRSGGSSVARTSTPRPPTSAGYSAAQASAAEGKGSWTWDERGGSADAGKTAGSGCGKRARSGRQPQGLKPVLKLNSENMVRPAKRPTVQASMAAGAPAVKRQLRFPDVGGGNPRKDLPAEASKNAPMSNVSWVRAGQRPTSKTAAAVRRRLQFPSGSDIGGGNSHQGGRTGGAPNKGKKKPTVVKKDSGVPRAIMPEVTRRVSLKPHAIIMPKFAKEGFRSKIKREDSTKQQGILPEVKKGPAKPGATMPKFSREEDSAKKQLHMPEIKMEDLTEQQAAMPKLLKEDPGQLQIIMPEIKKEPAKPRMHMSGIAKPRILMPEIISEEEGHF